MDEPMTDGLFYYISETLTIRGGRDPRGIRGDFVRRISDIGSMLKYGYAEVEDCRLKTEDGVWDFCGKEYTSRLHGIICRLGKAENIDFRIRYTCRKKRTRPPEHLVPADYCDPVGFKPEPDFLRKLRSDYFAAWKEPDAEDLLAFKDTGFFCSVMLLFSELEEGCEDIDHWTTYAFGEKDGKLHCGIVRPVSAGLRECEGRWVSYGIDLDLWKAYREPYASDPEVQACVKKLSSFTRPWQFTTADGQTVSDIGDTLLPSSDEAAAYFTAALRYMQLTGSDSAFRGLYFDRTTAAQVRTLEVSCSGTGWRKLHIRITQV